MESEGPVNIENEEEDNSIEDVKAKGLLGKIVNSENEAYELYKNFAHDCGFSVRKGKQDYVIGTKIVKHKWYSCSKQGFKYDVEPNEIRKSKPETRTGCNAGIKFSVDKGEWKVTHHVNEHNHPLASLEERHLLRSARSVAKGKAGEAILNMGIQTINTSYITQKCGGDEDLGVAAGKDLCTYVNTSEKTLIEVGDGQSLVNYFKRKTNEDGMFYWDLQLSQEGRMSNFFWRDGRSRIDYDYFGDVVLFDTTYRMNEYNLVCAPFIGVNHHWQNIMFGCAFLSDETAASFEWLFNTFLESMGNKAPKTIFTDEDAAMAKEIHKVFPNSSHRICLWHISKNATSHLSTLNSNRDFQKLFDKCQKWCENEEEFEDTWGKLMLDFDLKNHKWLNNLYVIRHKWSTAFNRNLFDGGIKSSQMSENVLNDLASKTSSLTDFILEFEEKVNEWRKTETKEDFRCQQSAPVRAIKGSVMLKNASQVYTHKIYKFFEKQYLDGTGATTFKENQCAETIYKFDVTMDGENSKVSKVFLDTSTMEVSCSCKKFETLGILCSHALCALHVKGIRDIPSQYILQRWTKDARERVYAYKQGGMINMISRESDLVFKNRFMRFAYEIGMMSQGQDDDLRELLMDGLANLKHSASGLIKNRSMDKGNLGKRTDNVSIDDEQPVLNPPHVRSKSSPNARLKDHFEKRRGKLETTTKKGKKVGPSTPMLTSSNSFQQAFRPQLVTQGIPPQVVTQGIRPQMVAQTFQPQIMAQGLQLHGFDQNHMDIRFPGQLQGVHYFHHMSQESSTNTWMPPK